MTYNLTVHGSTSRPRLPMSEYPYDEFAAVDRPLTPRRHHFRQFQQRISLGRPQRRAAGLGARVSLDYATLDQLRGHFPHARSLLMDRATLLAHRPLWGREDTPTQRELSRLHEDEAGLYDDLRHDRLGPAVRLEQERIGFAWVQAALAVFGPENLRGFS